MCNKCDRGIEVDSLPHTDDGESVYGVISLGDDPGYIEAVSKLTAELRDPEQIAQVIATLMRDKVFPSLDESGRLPEQPSN